MLVTTYPLAALSVLLLSAHAGAGYLVVDGRRVEVPFHVVHSLMNFADAARWAAQADATGVARAREGTPNAEDEAPRDGPWYRGALDWTGYVRPRQACRGVRPDGDAAARAAWQKAHCTALDAKKAVRLVVLHASRTRDAASLVMRLAERGLSTHLAVDWDGTVLQLADLGATAFHASGLNDLSVGVHVVNPLPTLRRGARPAPEPGVERPVLTERIHGVEMTSTGPTAAQNEALVALCRALVQIFPNVGRRVPRDAAGRLAGTEVASPARASGVHGHFHLTTARRDPGPGIDWDGIEAALNPRAVKR